MLQEYQQPDLPSQRELPSPEISPAEKKDTSATIATVRVAQFAIEGAALFPQQRLQDLLRDLIGRDLNLTELREAADRISSLYHAEGYPLASTFLPPQTVTDGTVKLIVVEGKYGEVRVQGSARLPDATVSNILSAQGIVSGNAITQPYIERGLLILQSMPATDATLSVQAGTAVGTSDVQVEAKAKNLISGELSYDNHTSRYIGAQRVTAKVNLNSPFGWSDQLNVRGTHAVDHDFVSANYTFPLGYTGLKVGGGASYLDYHLCCDFSVLDWQGEMTTFNLNASYPLILSKQRKLFIGAAYFNRHLRDEALGVEIDDRKINAAQLLLDAALSGSAETRINLTVTAANLDLSDNAGDQAQDAAGARSEGGFWKIRGALQQRWPVSSSVWLDYQLRGQWASNNLEGSEKFLLGGQNGVRAYPVGEGAGDMGLLARVELGTIVPLPIPGKLAASLFADAGTTWLHQSTFTGALGAGQSNHYTLAGTGVALLWALPYQLTAEASAAVKVGSNDGRITGGSDADGRNNRARGWVSLRWDF
ncbi:MAG: ShlB/FhaC/HecB family hemolysin secretion/activation protein [Methylophilaceae bacterium]